MFFLTVEEVVRAHRKALEEFGGLDGIRDQGLLESAVAMPKATFGGSYLHESLPEMAAAYLYHLCRNHPFLDGNKRVALACAEAFIDGNGARLEAANEELVELTLSVAEGKISKNEVAAFLADRVR